MKLISLPFMPSKKILKAFVIFLIFNTSVISQNNIYTTAGSDSACPGALITIPVNVIDCNNVAAISLKLNYDSTVLVYQGYQNLDPALAPGFLIVDSSGEEIALAWFSPFQSVNVGTSTLIEFLFTFIGGTTSLTWDTATAGNCEYQDINGSIIPALFFDGSVSQLGPPVNITNQPIDASVNQGTSAKFSVIATGANSYQWQADRNDGNGFVDIPVGGGIYIGANTEILNISSTSLPMSGWVFRCLVGGMCGSIISDIAKLTVTSIFATIVTTIDSIQACTGDQIIISVRVTNFIDVSALSHTILVDNTVLTYVGYQNVHPALGGFFLANGYPGGFSVSWFILNSQSTIPDGILYEMIFTYNGGKTCLQWNLSQPSNNEYNHQSILMFPATWLDGCVENAGFLPNILTQPVDITTNVNGTASFSVVVDAATMYQWEVSTDGGATWLTLTDGGVYSGTTTSVLAITGALAIMDQYQYRCVIHAPCNNMVTSNSATLTIVPQTTIITTASSVTSCFGSNTIVPIRVTEFMGVYKLNLELYYNISWLTYTGYSNPLPELASGTQFSIIETTPGKIVIEAESSDMYNGSFGDTVLVELLFIPITSPALMVWGQTNCWYQDSLSNSIPAYYFDGAITSNSTPLADAGPDQTVIIGMNTIMDGSATGGVSPYSWSWSPAALFVDATIENPTTVNLNATQIYTLVVTDANGCSSSDNVSIVIVGVGPLTANPTATPDTICDGGLSALNANPGGGSGTYTFLWTSDPPGFASVLENPTASPLVTTWYILTIDDGFATFTDSVLITVIPSPTIGAGPDATICEDASYTLTGTATNYSSTLWTTSGDGVFDDATLPGATYTPGAADIASGSVILSISVVGFSPCATVTDHMTLYFQLLPIANAGPDATICTNATYTLTGTASNQSSVLWTTAGDGAFSNNSIMNPVYTPGALDIANGIVLLTLTATSVPPCTSSTISSMTLYIQQTLQVDLGNDTTILINNPLTLHAGYPGSIYLWSTGETTENIVVSSAIDTTITYFVTVNDNGCVGSDSINITYVTQSTIITIIDSAYTCPGNTIIIPVRVIDCINIASISLKLGYDPSVLVYLGYQNPHPALAPGFLIVNSSGTQVALSWFSPFQSVNVGTDILLEFEFTYLGGSSALNWDTATSGNCQYGDINGKIFPALFIDGAVSLSNPPATITSQPIDTSISANGNASFSVTAINAIAHQWEESGDNGFTWIPLVDGGVYSGSNTASLNLTNVPVWMSGYRYRCIVSGQCPPDASSWTAILNVSSAYIYTRADTVTTCANTVLVPITVSNFIDVATINLKLDWDPSLCTYLGYQDVHNELYLNGFNPAFISSLGSLEISWTTFTGLAAQIGNDTLFTLLFDYNSNGNTPLSWDLITTSKCEYLDIGGAVLPAMWEDGFTNSPGAYITSNPVDKSVNDGMTVSFSVTAVGATSYLWQVDGNDGNGFVNCINGGIYIGVTTNTLNILSTNLMMNGYKYRCLIGGTCSVITNVVTLTVNSIFATIVTTIDSAIACTGDQIIIPVRVTNFIDVASLSHRLTFDTAVLTYTAYQNVNPVLTGFFLANGIEGNFAASWFNFVVGATIPDGILYEIVFTYNGGNTCIQWDLSQPDNNVYSHLSSAQFPATWIDGCVENAGFTPNILIQPNNKTINITGNTSFSFVVDAASSYQWEYSTDGGTSWINVPNTPPYSGVNTAILNITGASPMMDQYQYHCIAYGPCNDSVISNNAILTIVSQTTIVTTISSVIACQGDNAIVPILVTEFNGVFKFNLELVYNTLWLSYIGYTNPLPELSSGTSFSIVETTPGKIVIEAESWDMYNAVFGDTVLVELMFSILSSPAIMVWDQQNCWYEDSIGNNMPGAYVDGFITVHQSPTADAGPDVSICSGNYQVPELIYYKFDGGSASVTNYASAPVGYNPAPIIGLTVGGNGQFGTALQGNGGISQSNYTNTGWATNLGTGNWTISMWLDNFDTTNNLFYFFGDSAATSFRCFINGVAGAGNLMLRGPITDCNITGVGLGAAVVHYVYNGTDVRGYLNGDLNVTVAQGAVNINGTGFKVGGYSGSTSMNSGALLDEFRIYDRALSASEILETWNVQLGGCTSLTASGGTSYLWDNSQTTATIVVCPSVSTSYTVTVTDANGCTDSDDVLVTVNPIPLANAGPDQTIAGGTSAVFDGIVSGGSGTYTYNWTPAGLLVDPTVEDPVTVPLTSTTYFVFTATDAVTGCVSLGDTVTITIICCPINVNPIATPDTICKGDVAILQANPSGGSGSYTFSWTSYPPGFASVLENPTASPLVTTWYILTIDDGFATFTDSVLVVVIPVPSANAGPDATICYNNSYTMNGVATNYSTVLWTSTGDGTFDDITILGAIYTPGPLDIANGLVTLTLIATAIPPCTSAATSSMTLYIQQYLPVDLGNDTTILVNNTLNLHAGNPGCTYLWSNSATTETIVVSSVIDTSINYSVTVSDNYGCSGIDSINVTYISSGVIITKVDSITVCQGGTIIVPVHVKNFIGVSAFSLALNIDPAVLSFITFQNANPAISNGSLFIFQAGATVKFSWFIPGGSATIPDGILVELVFNSICASSPLIWDTLNPGECEYIDSTSSVIPASFINGWYECVGPTPVISGPIEVCEYETGVIYSTPFVVGNLYNWGVTGGVITAGQGTNQVTVSWGSYGIGTVVVTETSILTACSVTTANYNVIIHPLPLVDAGPDQIIAWGTQTILNGTVTGGSGTYTYMWSPDSLLVDATMEDPTTILFITNTIFYFIATDVITGCISSSDSVTVYTTGPQLQVMPEAIPDTICIGDSVTLYANPSWGSGTYTFSWTSNPPGFTSTVENPVVSPIVTTTYTVTVDDGFNTASGSVTVTIIPIANAGADATICEDATYILSGSAYGQSSVLWSTSGDGVFDDATLLGATYSPGPNDINNGSVVLILLVNAGSPCTTSATDNMTLFIQLLPIANAGAEATICEGETYTLMGTSSNQSSVLWTTAGDGTFDDATLLGAVYTLGPNDISNGSVVLTLTATPTLPCGAVAISSMTININPAPMVDLGNDTTICYYNTLTLHAGNPGNIYLWSTGETIESITVSSSTPNTIIHYYVTVTDNNACNGMDDIYVTFDDCVSLKDIIKVPLINIFPNPSSGKFNIHISNMMSNMEMFITNIHGQTILKDNFMLNSSSYIKELELSHLPKGIYFINFRNENFVKTEKLVVQ